MDMTRYIIFSSGLNIDKYVTEFEAPEGDFEGMVLENEEDYIEAFGKIEQFGSFCFLTEANYKKVMEDNN